jgi:hypothetical protein
MGPREPRTWQRSVQLIMKRLRGFVNLPLLE